MAKQTKAEREHELLAKRAFPKITKIAVFSPDPLNNSYLLDLEDVSYIATRNAVNDNIATLAQEGKKTKKKTKPSKKTEDKNSKEFPGEIVFVCRDGREYSNYTTLRALEEKLEIEEGNVWFMRTSNSYIVNLREITETRVNHARDLFFKNIKGRILNALTRTYFDKFQACTHIL